MAIEETIQNEASALDTEVNGTPFSVLLSQAVKLKSAQEAPLRSKFNSFPSFYQNSIFPRDEVIKARQLDFQERMEKAVHFKSMGNNALTEHRYMEAITFYEMAMSVFKYLVNTNPNWKNEGIKDDYVREERFLSQTKDQSRQVNDLLILLYTNIAVVSFRTKQFHLAIQACDEAITLDSTNIKALYLRSKARLAPKSAGKREEDMAISDLRKARRTESTNKEVKKELQRLLSNRAKVLARDKAAFNDIFKNGKWLNSECMKPTKDPIVLHSTQSSCREPSRQQFTNEESANKNIQGSSVAKKLSGEGPSQKIIVFSLLLCRIAIFVLFTRACLSTFRFRTDLLENVWQWLAWG